MRQLILGARKQREGVAQVKAHRFAPPGNGDVQRRLRVVGEPGHQRGNGIGGAGIFFRGADVGQRLPLGIAYLVDMGLVKHRMPQLRVVRQQGMELSTVGVQQGRSRQPCAFGGGQEVNLSRQKRLPRRPGLHRQRVQGFSHDLREEAGNGQQDATGVGHGRAVDLVAVLFFQSRRY